MEKQYKPYDLNIYTLGFYVTRVSYALLKRLNQGLKESDLDIQFAEFTIMKALDEIKGASQSQIASVLGKERAGITKPMSSLEEKGYISREALNGSTNYVTLTEKGKNAIPVLNEIADRVTEQAFKGFSQKSRTSTINNLNRIFNNTITEEK